MPTTKTKPAARASRKLKTTAKHAWQGKDIGQRINIGTKEELKRHFDEFLEFGRAEELRFLVEIFRDRDNMDRSESPKGRYDYEVPLYSAIETAINDNSSRVITLPHEAMLGPVSDFIEGLEKAAETDSTVLEYKQTPYSQVCEQRKADLKHFIEMFCTKAAADDLYFLYSVIARWADILEYNQEMHPTSPIMSAFQFEIDHQHWLLKVSAASRVENSKMLIALLSQGGWLAELLEWIAKNQETISPCEVGKEAFRHQQAFDKALPAADVA